MDTSKEEATVDKLLAAKNYPIKDGGVYELSSDSSNILIYNAGGGLVHFEFEERGIAVIVDLAKGTKIIQELEEFINQGASAKAAIDLPGDDVTVRLKPAPEPEKLPPTKTGAKKDMTNMPADPVKQLDYHRKTEVVDRRYYCNEITCECGNKRWIPNADIHQCTKCKPCIQRGKNKRSRIKRKGRR